MQVGASGSTLHSEADPLDKSCARACVYVLCVSMSTSVSSCTHVYSVAHSLARVRAVTELVVADVSSEDHGHEDDDVDCYGHH